MILEMKRICKDYSLGKEPVPVLKNIDLQVEEGDYIAIMGPSGSGKSTLMNIIGCLDKQTSGEFILDGVDISACSDKDLSVIRNKKIGFVFQNFNLLPRQSILDNVALPLLYAGVKKKERRALAAEALRSVGLEERVRFYPTQLSGGQKQRAAIARAMISKPALLLADEPTGALDTRSGEQVMKLFKELNSQGITIIMITHEREIAEHANKIMHIRDGELRQEQIPVEAHKEQPSVEDPEDENSRWDTRPEPEQPHETEKDTAHTRAAVTDTDDTAPTDMTQWEKPQNGGDELDH